MSDDLYMKLELVEETAAPENAFMVQQRVKKRVFGFRGLRGIGNNFHSYKYLVILLCTIWILIQFIGLTYAFMHVVRRFLRTCCDLPPEYGAYLAECLDARDVFHDTYIHYPKPFLYIGFITIGLGFVFSSLCLMWPNPYIQWISLLLYLITFGDANLLIPLTQDVFDEKVGLGALLACGNQPPHSDKNWMDNFVYVEIPAAIALLLEMWDYVIRNRKKIERKIVEKWQDNVSYRLKLATPTVGQDGQPTSMYGEE